MPSDCVLWKSYWENIFNHNFEFYFNICLFSGQLELCQCEFCSQNLALSLINGRNRSEESPIIRPDWYLWKILFYLKNLLVVREQPSQWL